MEDTLVEIIGELEEFGNLGKKFEYDLDEKKLRNAEIKKLRKFYQENSLVCKVVEGKGSYVELIKPIEEKYNSFWKKIRVPKIDKTFDNEVRRVIESMNNVGVEYINPENFTTDVKRIQNKITLLSSGGAGLFFAALPILCGGSYTANYNSNIFVPIMIAGGMYLGLKLIGYTGTKLVHLQKSAQKTDEFLTQHYLKLPPP